MNASFNKGATLIALRPLPSVAGRSFSPGDVFAWRVLAVSERRVAQMIEQGKVGELSQQTYDFAMKQKESADDGVPRGFTRDGLAHIGIKLKGDKPKAAKPAADLKVDYDATETHRGYTLGRKKVGATQGYDVFDAEGARLNAGGLIRGLKAVDRFIDTLETEAAKNAAAAQEQVSAGADAGAERGGGDAATAPEPAVAAEDTAAEQTGEGGGDAAPADEEGDGYEE
jgi:hypothetical protein